MTKQTILAVDDKAHVLQLLRTTLQLAGYHVLTAGDGLEGLQDRTATRRGPGSVRPGAARLEWF